MPFAPSVCALCAGVAVVASWIAVRYPRLAPRTRGGVTAWLCAALAATGLASRAIPPVRAAAGLDAAFLLVVLPSGVCVMLAAAWTIRFVGEMLGVSR